MRIGAASAVIMLAAWLAAFSAGAQVAPGEQDYRDYCLVCHGPTGKGDGQAVYVLAGLKPGDLTQLAKSHGGSFPSQIVHAAITGRDQIAAHHLGQGGVPLWKSGLETGASGPSVGSRAAVQTRIRDMIQFIQSLQQK